MTSSPVFSAPLLGVMAGAGILKGLLLIAINMGWLQNTDTTYIILYAAADSLFYFLPLLLAVTTARKFQGNAFVALTIAGALIYPTIIQLKRTERRRTFRYSCSTDELCVYRHSNYSSRYCDEQAGEVLQQVPSR